MISSLKRIATTVAICATALLTGLGSAVAEPMDFPLLTNGASPAHLPGKVVWADLVSEPRCPEHTCSILTFTDFAVQGVPDRTHKLSSECRRVFGAMGEPTI